MEQLNKPLDNQKVIFTDLDGKKHEGTYIESENIFCIGFSESCDFLFAWQIESWKPHESTNHQ